MYFTDVKLNKIIIALHFITTPHIIQYFKIVITLWL